MKRSAMAALLLFPGAVSAGGGTRGSMAARGPGGGPVMVGPLYSAVAAERARALLPLSGAIPDLSGIDFLNPVSRAALAPLVWRLQEGGLDWKAFTALEPFQQLDRLPEAYRQAQKAVREEASRLCAEAEDLDAARPDAALVAARLHMLQTVLSPYLSEEERGAVSAGYRAARARLEAREAELLEESLRAVAAALSGRRPSGLTVVERLAVVLPMIPSYVVTPRLARLRAAEQRARAWDKRLPRPPAPSASPGAAFQAKLGYVRMRQALKRGAARVYRPLLELFRRLMTHAGELFRKYLSGREMDAHSWRWHVLEGLFIEGDFRGSFGHPVFEGAFEVLSPLRYRSHRVADLGGQAHRIGRDLAFNGETVPVRRVESGPMIQVSGMSFPQLSAQSHLSLLYIHLKLAKEQGLRTLYNTGEGGPDLHLALLGGDWEKVRAYVVEWNRQHGHFKPGSLSEAKLVHLVDRLRAAREALFSEFSPEDLSRAQVVAQFGSYLNGIRGDGNRVDFDKLRAVAEDPRVAMIQYKLKQAAKRGGKIDPKKVDDMVAAFRDLPRGSPVKSPELNPELHTYESVARLILATKMVSGKPVSLKFGIGDPADAHDLLAFLRDAGALPDHIQLDGRGPDFSPGSGNAPPGANTSLPLNEAVIVMDAILKKLGVRDQVHVEATGDILLPAEAVEKLALGSDSVSGGRVWMAMGLGCAMVRACAQGNCPYGIASLSDSLAGLAMDPRRIGPQGHRAAANWHKALVQTLVETQTRDWRTLRSTHGLASRTGLLRKRQGFKALPLDRVYDEGYVTDLLRGVMTREEVERVVFGRRS